MEVVVVVVELCVRCLLVIIIACHYDTTPVTR